MPALDRLQDAKRRGARALHLDQPRLTPRVAAAVYKFRVSRGWAPPTLEFLIDAQLEAMQPIASGCSAEMHINGVFPHTTCFVQVDLAAFAIRWAPELFISLGSVEDVKLDKEKRRLSSFIHLVGSTTGLGPKFIQGLEIIYSGQGGLKKVLKMHLPAQQALEWAGSLKLLFEKMPQFASPGLWRWSLSCMAATSKRGATGLLLRAELRWLIRCANGNSSIGHSKLEEALRASDASVLKLVRNSQARNADKQKAKRLLGGRGHRPAQRLLSAPEVTGLLVHLCTESPTIAALFDRHAVDEQMRAEQWLRFYHAEQLNSQLVSKPDWAPDGSTVLDEEGREELRGELTRAQRQMKFGSTSSGVEGDMPERDEGWLGPQKFALLVLDPQNDVVMPARKRSARDSTIADLGEPLTHYWIACSHNSCMLPGLKPWLLDSHPLNPTIGAHRPSVAH
jgi:hypothetical protein